MIANKHKGYHRYLNISIYLLLLVFISKVAISQSLEFPKTIETYIGGNLLFDFNNDQEDFGSSGRFLGKNTKKTNSLMLRWGYREESTYAIEVGYINIPKTNAKSTNNYQTQHSMQGAFADLFLFFPLSPQISVYGKIGTMYGQVDSTLYIPGDRTTTGSENKWGSSTGIGLEYLVDTAFAIRGGWESVSVKNSNTGKFTHNSINVGGLIFYE